MAVPPARLAVVCGPCQGEYLTASGRVVVRGSGAEVTPTEFERLGGKGSCKKWKVGVYEGGKLRCVLRAPAVTPSAWGRWGSGKHLHSSRSGTVVL